ncbi:unnamed protein product [Symbiodinium natans]|uniref:Uncharacterized protein n=1 Tax=Symbiodinium natans TaxID=878477 RepID=A0A812LMI9_9DINO|nr:unnamed protein product [Symbiodinium natans]
MARKTEGTRHGKEPRPSTQASVRRLTILASRIYATSLNHCKLPWPAGSYCTPRELILCTRCVLTVSVDTKPHEEWCARTSSVMYPDGLCQDWNKYRRRCQTRQELSKNEGMRDNGRKGVWEPS